MKKISPPKADLLRAENSFRGFTLIELLIVISIIGILMSVVVANFHNVRKKSRDTQRKSHLVRIASAVEAWRANNHAYPPKDRMNELLDPTRCDNAAYPFGEPIESSNKSIVYLDIVPCDPSNVAYTYTCDEGFRLTACLENTDDPQKDSTNQYVSCTSNSGPPICPSGTWSYTIDRR